jgi:4-amino-4-deoxy-L-arabinose transferase-like glycosyltransferase
MRFLAPFQTIHRAAGRWRGALTDPARAERAVLVSLTVYLVVWTVYGTIAKSSQGLHPDMTEVIAWSRDLSLGYLKHPPLAAAIVWAWFSVFPVAEWSYYLLAMLMPVSALWIAWRLSADYLDIEKRVVGLALLTLIPFFNFHALKFNVNTVLMPLWAATTLWFLRSYRIRSARYAVLAGLGAAACMLGKYWSVFLLAGLIVAALIDRRRGAYFRSAAPWITVAVGAAALSSHLVWLVQHHFAPFSYAIGIHGEKPFGATLVSALGYLGGSVGYVAVPLIVVAIMARAKPAALAGMAWPADTERRLAASAFWAPLLLPVVGAVAGRTEITSLWSMPAWTLLPVLLLSPPAVTVREVDTRRLLIAAAAVPLVMLLAAPVIATIAQRQGPAPASAQAPLLAQQVESLWHQMTPQPLRFVGGETDLAYGVITYAPERPRALSDMPQPSAEALKQSGMVLVCFADDSGCRRAAEARASGVAGSRTIVSDITRGFLGYLGKPQRYTIVIVPPRR